MNPTPYILVEQEDCWHIVRIGNTVPVAEVTAVEPNFMRYLVEALNACAFKDL